jgi:hypothetical protein
MVDPTRIQRITRPAGPPLPLSLRQATFRFGFDPDRTCLIRIKEPTVRWRILLSYILVRFRFQFWFIIDRGLFELCDMLLLFLYRGPMNTTLNTKRERINARQEPFGCTTSFIEKEGCP